MTVWSNGQKSRLRKYYPTLYIKELHTLFNSAYPNNPVGLAKFASLRPPNVLLLKDQPRDQCKCRLHENFVLKLKALHINYVGSQFWKSALCEDLGDDEWNSECWKITCSVCQKGSLFF